MPLEGHDIDEIGNQTGDTFTKEEISLTEACDPGCDVARKTPLWIARLLLDGVKVYLYKCCLKLLE